MLVLALLNERLTREPLERAQAGAARRRASSMRNCATPRWSTALGMLPAADAALGALKDAALLEQMRASASGGAFSALTKFARQVIQMRCSPPAPSW